WAALAITGMVVINYFGVRTAGRFQVLVTGLKVAAIIFIIGLGLGSRNLNGMLPSAGYTGEAYGGVSAYLASMVPVMLAYNGFQSLGQVGGEIAAPHKTVPRAAIFSVLTVAVLYFLINLVYFRVLGAPAITNSQNVASDTAAKLAGPGGARWLTM